MAESWSRLECEAIVRDYFDMFRKEVTGLPYSKAEHRRALQKLLKERSDGFVEYKHQNISAILLQSGLPYIPGYKPAFNYQALLKEVVHERAVASDDELNALVCKLSCAMPEKPVIHEWSNVLDEPPERIIRVTEKAPPHYAPSKCDYAELERRNRKLGELGEEFVIEYERHRLVKAGRADLAKEVEWISKERGDGAGYDIRSFDETRESERFIEVKTTNSGKYQPFLISDNEVKFSVSAADRYCLYRVYDFRRSPRLFLLPGSVENHVVLSAKLYSASF